MNLRDDYLEMLIRYMQRVTPYQLSQSETVWSLFRDDYLDAAVSLETWLEKRHSETTETADEMRERCEKLREHWAEILHWYETADRSAQSWAELDKILSRYE